MDGMPRFRLRTLFLIMTIVAVQCAVCLPALKEWQERKAIEESIQKIVDELEHLGGGTEAVHEPLQLNTDEPLPESPGDEQ